MKFSDIPGHEDIKTRLRQIADSDRIPHALLIEGPTGTGKVALARAFAQYIHCRQRTPDGNPCGVCPSCLQHQSLNHIDTLHVFPVVKQKNSKSGPIADDYLELWREYLADNLYLSPQEWASRVSKTTARPSFYVEQSADLMRRLALTANVSKYKIVILWQPELMNDAAANKLLKLVEEPFPDTKFIMVSESPGDILPTIYSRLQRIAVRRLSDETVAGIIQSSHTDIDAAQAAAIAHIAEGSMTNAAMLLDRSKMRSEFLEQFMSLMRLAYQRKVYELREWSNKLTELGRDNEINFYEYAIRMMRENFVYNLHVPQITYLDVKEEEFSSRFARFITHRNVERLIAAFEDARTDIAANGNGKIINFDLAIKVILLIKDA